MHTCEHRVHAGIARSCGAHAVTDHPLGTQGTGLGPRAFGGPQLLKYVLLCLNFHLTAAILGFNMENFRSRLRRS